MRRGRLLASGVSAQTEPGPQRSEAIGASCTNFTNSMNTINAFCDSYAGMPRVGFFGVTRGLMKGLALLGMALGIGDAALAQAPAIVTQPASLTRVVGASASFTLAASGNPVPTYQWQRRPVGSSVFSNVSNGNSFTGSTAATLTVPVATFAMDGDQFRCLASNSGGSVTSSAVTLTIAPAPQRPTVSIVNAAPRTGTKFVDITYDLAHPTGLSSTVRVEVSLDGGVTYATAVSVTGAVGAGIAPGTGKTVGWNAGQDIPAAPFGNVRVRLAADDGQGSVTPPTSMALVPAGAFAMGDSSNDVAPNDIFYGNELPVRTVTVSALYAAKTELTLAEWKEVRNWAVNHGYTDLLSIDASNADALPVQGVSWYDAVRWLNAKSENEGLTPVYYTDAAQTTVYRTGILNLTAAQVQWTASGYRLPTEAEWEKAARGGAAGTRFPTGNTISQQLANYYSNPGYPFDASSSSGYHPSYGGGAAPVGSFAANGYGLFDMAGNVFEWCWDFYGIDPGITDPLGPTSGGERDIRGGAMFSEPIYLRNSFRGHIDPGTRYSGLGFRPVRSASGSNAIIAISSAFALDLSVAPAISTQPVGQVVSIGSAATFGVVASGTAPLLYQWRKDGVAITGATSASYVIPSATAGDGGGYDVVVTNGAGNATSIVVTLVVNPSPTAPSIVAHPQSQQVNAGSNVTFVVSATGMAPLSYQWRKNGANIAGATNAALTLPAVQAGDAGSYNAVVTNSAGSITSNAAGLTVNVTAFGPLITIQPLGQVVNPGVNVILTVIASSVSPLTYQWRKNGSPVSGATNSSFAIFGAQTSDAASYTVVVSNVAGDTVSDVALLSVVPDGNSATHAVVGAGYSSGSTVTITNLFAYTDTAMSAGWQVLLPDGWSFASDGGSVGETKPAPGQTGYLEWAWTNVPPSPVTFTYTVNVPAGTAGAKSLAGLAVVRPSGTVVQLLVHPDPLVVSQVFSHSADTDRNFRLGLFELTRVIELYNTRLTSLRTGRYKVQPGTEDGFAADAVSIVNQSLTLYHSADSNRDGQITLVELTRVIELYNTRSGTTRTGQYHVQAGTEDGYAPGP